MLHESALADPLDFSERTQAHSVQLVFRDTAGRPVHVQARCVPVLRDGCPEGWVLAFNATRRADEIEQLKNELVSTVSHELKTPLAAIKAYTATLRHNPSLYETRRNEFLEVVEQQADRLARLVDDMLVVTRVETGQMLRRRLRVPLQSILDAAIDEIAVDPVKYSIECRGPGVEVSGDPDRLRDVFRNVIENAVKYSPEGGRIVITACESGGYTRIEVRDSGVGIPEEDLPYIYDRFYRAQSDTAPQAGGSGLGLYIVNALVRAHGGTIDVRSEPGEGTAFTVKLPLR